VSSDRLSSGPAPVNRFPVLLGRRSISRPAIRARPSSRVDILSSAKKAPKQCDSLSGSFFPILQRQSRLDGRRARRFGRWDRDIVFRQKLPQAGIFLSQSRALCIGRLERNGLRAFFHPWNSLIRAASKNRFHICSHTVKGSIHYPRELALFGERRQTFSSSLRDGGSQTEGSSWVTPISKDSNRLSQKRTG
jgi:hypothetical protein